MKIKSDRTDKFAVFIFQQRKYLLRMSQIIYIFLKCMECKGGMQNAAVHTCQTIRKRYQGLY